MNVGDEAVDELASIISDNDSLNLLNNHITYNKIETYVKNFLTKSRELIIASQKSFKWKSVLINNFTNFNNIDQTTDNDSSQDGSENVDCDQDTLSDDGSDQEASSGGESTQDGDNNDGLGDVLGGSNISNRSRRSRSNDNGQDASTNDGSDRDSSFLSVMF